MFPLRFISRAFKHRDTCCSVLHDIKPLAAKYATFEEAQTPSESTPMEKTVNQVTLLGRVGGEPIKKGTPEHPVVIFSLATHTHYKYETGETSQKTDWHRISVFKPSLRDLVFSYLHRGQRVLVTGRVSYGSIKEDTTIKNTTSIIADDIIFFHSGSNENS